MGICPELPATDRDARKLHIPMLRIQCSLRSQLYLRETIIYLNTVLKSLSVNIKYLHLYCDILSIQNVPESGKVHLTLPSIDHNNLRYVHIYTRKFIDDKVRYLVLDQLRSVKIRIFFESTSRDLELAWTGQLIQLARVTVPEPSEDEDKVRATAERTKAIGKEIYIGPNRFEVVDLFAVPYTETDPPVSPPSAARESQSGPK